MIKDFSYHLITGLIKPRLSARWIIDKKLGMLDIILLVLLGLIIQQLLVKFVGGFAENLETPALSIISFGRTILLNLASFFIISFLVYFIGSKLGGTGDLNAVRSVIAWYTVTSTLLAIPLMILTANVTPESPDVLSGLMLAVFFLYMMLFATYVTEAHGFKNPLKVAASIFGIVMLISIALTPIIAGLGILPAP